MTSKWGFLLAAALMLGGCVSIVSVRSEGGPARLSVWAGGVRIERGRGDAVSVSQRTLGLAAVCGLVGLGFTQARCAVIDPASCGVAILETDRPASPAPSALLTDISGASRAHCLKEGPRP